MVVCYQYWLIYEDGTKSRSMMIGSDRVDGKCFFLHIMFMPKSGVTGIPMVGWRIKQ